MLKITVPTAQMRKKGAQAPFCLLFIRSSIVSSAMLPQSLLYLFLSLQLVATQNSLSSSIDLQHFGNYADLRGCSKDCLADFCCNYNLAGQLGCTTNECFCGHQSDGNVILEKCINSYCLSDSGDLASATSFYGAYCANYLASATPTASTIQNGEGSPAGRPVLTTITPTGIFPVEHI